MPPAAPNGPANPASAAIADLVAQHLPDANVTTESWGGGITCDIITFPRHTNTTAEPAPAEPAEPTPAEEPAPFEEHAVQEDAVGVAIAAWARAVFSDGGANEADYKEFMRQTGITDADAIPSDFSPEHQAMIVEFFHCYAAYQERVEVAAILERVAAYDADQVKKKFSEVIQEVKYEGSVITHSLKSWNDQEIRSKIYDGEDQTTAAEAQVAAEPWIPQAPQRQHTISANLWISSGCGRMFFFQVDDPDSLDLETEFNDILQGIVGATFGNCLWGIFDGTITDMGGPAPGGRLGGSSGDVLRSSCNVWFTDTSGHLHIYHVMDTDSFEVQDLPDMSVEDYGVFDGVIHPQPFPAFGVMGVTEGNDEIVLAFFATQADAVQHATAVSESDSLSVPAVYDRLIVFNANGYNPEYDNCGNVAIVQEIPTHIYSDDLDYAPEGYESLMDDCVHGGNSADDGVAAAEPEDDDLDSSSSDDDDDGADDSDYNPEDDDLDSSSDDEVGNDSDSDYNPEDD